MSNKSCYTEPVGELLLEVIEGKALAAKDITGSSDPYCVIDLKGNSEKRTEVINQNLNPKWKDSVFNFNVYSKDDVLTIDVFDEDKFSADDFMGRVQIKLSEYMDEDPHNMWVELKTRGKKKEKVKGKIHLLVSFTNSPSLEAEMRTEFSKVEALLLLPDCSFVKALAKSTRQSEMVAKSIVSIVSAHDYIVPLLLTLLTDEIDETIQETTLFRVDSWTTKMAKQLFVLCGSQYVIDTLRGPIASVLEDKMHLEVDPDRLGMGKTGETKAEENLPHLMAAVNKIFGAITESVDSLPREIREVLHHVTMTVRKRFPSSRHTVIGGFLFLRFFCPAVWSPDTFGILTDATSPPRNALDEEGRRALVLIAKTLQNISNHVEFASKEPFMKPMNGAVVASFDRATEFFNEVVSLASGVAPSEEEEGVKSVSASESKMRARDLKVVHQFVKKNYNQICREFPLSREDFGKE